MRDLKTITEVELLEAVKEDLPASWNVSGVNINDLYQCVYITKGKERHSIFLAKNKSNHRNFLINKGFNV